MDFINQDDRDAIDRVGPIQVDGELGDENQDDERTRQQTTDKDDTNWIHRLTSITTQDDTG